MKVAINLSVLIATSAAITMNHTMNEIDAETICGELSVIKVGISELPEDVSPEDIRLCAQHPLGRNRTLDASIPPEYMENDPPDME